MKISEMLRTRQASIGEYIKERGDQYQAEYGSTLDRILSYIFGLNAGGIVAVAAYLSAKPVNGYVVISIVLFCVGLLLAVLRAVLDYYICELSLRGFNRDVGALYDEVISWEEFMKRRKRLSDTPLHVLGITSGICFFVGLVFGILGCMK